MRKIADVLPIRDADELLVYFHKEQCFFRINQQNFHSFFPKKEGRNRCRICPNFYIKYTGKLAACQTKIESFSMFKSHIAESEKIFGELVAFKNGSKLPDKSTYKKHRMYGHLWPFQTKEDFLMFDTRLNKFVRIQRKNIKKTFTKKGICNFCPCNRKLQSSTTVIKHLQVLETRFFCYLVLDDERYNDTKNQERLSVYLKCIATKEINSKLFSRRTNFTGSPTKNSIDSKFVDEETDYGESDASFGEEEEEEESDENALNVLNEFKNSYTQIFDKITNQFGRLRTKMNAGDLNRGIIDAQKQLSLIKRNEDFQEREKNFTLMKSIKLNYENLDYLMNKYEISNDYEIESAEINFNLQLKDVPLIGREISIPIKPVDLNDSQFALIQQESKRPQMCRRSVPFANQQSNRVKSIVYEAEKRTGLDIEYSVDHRQTVEKTNVENSKVEVTNDEKIDDRNERIESTNTVVHRDKNASNGIDHKQENDESMHADEIDSNENIRLVDQFLIDHCDYVSKENTPDQINASSLRRKIKIEKCIDLSENESSTKRVKID